MMLSIRHAAISAALLLSATDTFCKSLGDPAVLKRFRAEIEKTGLYPADHPDIKACLKWEMKPLGKDSLQIKATSGGDRSCKDEVYFGDSWTTSRKPGPFSLVAGNDGELRIRLQEVSGACNSVEFPKRFKMEGVLRENVLDKLSAEIQTPGGKVTIPASMVLIRYFDCVQENLEEIENSSFLDVIMSGGGPKESSPEDRNNFPARPHGSFGTKKVNPFE